MKKSHYFLSSLIVISLLSTAVGYGKSNYVSSLDLDINDDQSSSSSTIKGEAAPAVDPSVLQEKKLAAVCEQKYLKAKAEYLTAMAQYIELDKKRKSARNKGILEAVSGVAITGLSIFLGQKTDNPFLQTLAWGTGITGGIMAIDGTVKSISHGSRDTEVFMRPYNGGFKVGKNKEIEKPSVPHFCSGKWDMDTYAEPEQGVYCSLTIMDEQGRPFEPSKSMFQTYKTFVCYSNSAKDRLEQEKNARTLEQFLDGYKFDENGNLIDAKDCSHCR